MHLTYDQAGRPLVICYNGTNYYYKLNLQGDVIGIINTSGTEVVSYTYDAWGQQLTCTGSLTSTLGADNPLRYRGYIYDTETELYYLQARYYNPEWGRFISADTVLGAVGGINTQNGFAYCTNNPVNMKDLAGNAPYNVLMDDSCSIFGLYRSEIAAVDAWATYYRGLSNEYEYCAFVYSCNYLHRTIYFLSETSKGMAGDPNRFLMDRANVVVPLFKTYIKSHIKRKLLNIKIVAFIHSHPAGEDNDIFPKKMN